MKIIEQFIDFYVISLYQESKKLIEYKSLILILGFIRIIRRMSLLFLLFLTACIQLTAGFFALLVEVIHQYQVGVGFEINSVVVAGILLIILGFSLLNWSLSEKHWLRAFDIQKRIVQLNTKSNSEELFRSSRSLSDIDENMEELIDKKIEKYFEGVLGKDL